jgi:hypothetical protein
MPKLMTTGNYTPAKEFDGALGLFYDFGHVGPFKELAPMFTVYGSVRTHDLGIEANTPNSGYDRLLLAPGGEIDSEFSESIANDGQPGRKPAVGA